MCVLGYAVERYLTSEDDPPFNESRRIEDYFSVMSLKMSDLSTQNDLSIWIWSEADANDNDKLVEVKMKFFKLHDMRKSFYGGMNLGIESSVTAKSIVEDGCPPEGVSFEIFDILKTCRASDFNRYRGQRFMYHIVQKALDIFSNNPSCKRLYVVKEPSTEDQFSLIKFYAKNE
ncbi:hypothetical protein QR680_014347 [Steinernema hermaphroditum]|uniref:Uncharacterized protein n=1 Tax=Steinernema hermaphroditum TaxID=289476 RepID=A0AA39M425_9BILA|nr:hypothetical protein QR680_014347 [Steinernema hermaphroditum]